MVSRLTPRCVDRGRVSCRLSLTKGWGAAAPRNPRHQIARRERSLVRNRNSTSTSTRGTAGQIAPAPTSTDTETLQQPTFAFLEWQPSSDSRVWCMARYLPSANDTDSNTQRPAASPTHATGLLEFIQWHHQTDRYPRARPPRGAQGLWRPRSVESRCA